MAPAILASALKEFELAIDDLASSFEFVRAAARLRPRLTDMLYWQNMDGEAKALATAFLRQGAAEASLLYRGLVISLSGAFEHFVRRIVRDSVTAMNKAKAHYDALDDALKKQNAYRTGIALQTIFEPPDYLDLDYEILSKNIGTCFVGSKQPVLNAEAFTIFLSIISPEKLVDAFGRTGVKVQWDALGRIPAMRTVLEKKDTRETAKALQEFLKRFGQTRNKIAHTGSSGVVVTEADFDQLLMFFRTFGRALTSVLEAELAKHCHA
jgi:HEPN superfamily RiboL-PSP-like protein